MNEKISVIMPCTLSIYAGGAKERKIKLHRALDSFFNQSFENKELIVVSDGCVQTSALVLERNSFSKEKIRLISIPKQPLFSGNVRQAGLEAATGHKIAYLDSDDYFTPSHLANINYGMNARELDWCYYSDYVKTNKTSSAVRNVTVAYGSIGTSSIAHLRSLEVSWAGCDGYGHDWQFVQRLKEKSSNHSKIYGCGYVVCHIKGKTDL